MISPGTVRVSIPLIAVAAFLAISTWATPSATMGGSQDIDVIFAPTGTKREIQKRISDEIGRARKQVLVAVYHLTSKDIARALVLAKRKGIDVRVLVDGVQTPEDGKWGEAAKILMEGKVPMKRVYPGEGNQKKWKGASRIKFHHKFCVLDGKRLITGSYNWTVLADERNHENLILLTNKITASKFQMRFEEIWKDEDLTSKE